MATSPGAWRAQARAEIAATGLRLCGIEEEPPGAASRTSPTSVCASSTTSPAGFAIAPQAMPERGGELADPGALGVPRQHGLGEPELARRSAPAPPAPRPSSVPAGPPSCAAGRNGVEPRRRPRRAPRIQPAALSPNVVGTACWSSVRPIIGVARCSRASRAAASAAAREVLAQRAERVARRRASRPCRGCPGSWRRGGPPGPRRRARAARSTSGTTGLPLSAARSPSSRGSRLGGTRRRSRRDARAARAPAPAPPPPSSIARSHAASATASATRPRASTPSNILELQPHVVLGQRRRRRLASAPRTRAASAAAAPRTGRRSCRCSIWVIHHEKCCTRQTRRRQRSE